jgi:hypothetical protein
MPDSLLEYAHLDVGSVKSIAIEGEEENQHLGLHLFPGQSKVHGGIRAEISVGYPFQQGETVRYSWRFMLPKDFVSDAPKNRWWIIGQWHDQPDRARGETWDRFPSKSPPVLLALGELDGKLGIGITYGPDHSQQHGPVFIEPGKWHEIAVEIHWSRNDEGKATVFLDDMTRPVATCSGPNLHNDFQHYLKIGMYRHPDIATDNWIYLDDLRIGKR